MYGQEIRERIVRALERGIEIKEISYVFGVSTRMIYALRALYRETGSVTPRKIKGRPSKLTEADLRNIESRLKERPDITLEELRDELGLSINISNLSRAIRYKLGYTYKKRWFMQQNRNVPM